MPTFTNHAPRDRTRREHIAAFDRVLWSDYDTARVIAKLADGSVVVGTQAADWFARGVEYRFLGRWTDHATKGAQFAFDSVVAERPLSAAGVTKYLCDVAPNVGQKTAARLFAKYGPDAVAVLRESPGRVQEDGLMGLDAAVEASAALKECHALERTTIELHGLFAGRGFGGACTNKALKLWGVRAPRIIERNPFILLSRKLPGAGFKRCDKMWLDIGKRRDALKRQFFCAWNYLRTAGDGHTWFRAEDVCQVIVDAIAGPAADPIKALRLGKRAGWVRTRKDGDGRTWVAEAAKAIDEQSIADSLRRLQAWCGERLWPATIPVSQVEGDGLPSVHQVERATISTAGPVGILCGGPGTGKTHTLAFILRAMLASGEVSLDDIAVASPTGKAAVRASQSLSLQSIDLRATTIHRLLQIGRNGHDGDGWGFQHNRSNPLPFRVVILDEVSMVDTGLMASFMEACADGTHVLFIGDDGQLMPVGHGAPLRDMKADCVPTGELTEVRRNAGQNVHACVRIKAGEQFDTCDKYDPAIGHNLRMIETTDDGDTLDCLESIMQGMRLFHPVWQSQVLVGVNDRGNLSRKIVNDRLHALLNPEGRAATGNPFRVGDKIICLKNGEYTAVWPMIPEGQAAIEDLQDAKFYRPTPPDGDRYGGGNGGDSDATSVYVANGEIGRVVAVADRLTIARIGEGDLLVKIPMGKQREASEDGGGEGDSTGGSDSEAKGRGCHFDLAYAISVHKAQGSEAPCVIVLVDQAAGRVADRSWWYTAVSRASKLCVIIGQKAVLDRQRIKQSLVKRKTFLADLIKGAKQ
jgi:exodeoxyribonuclease V alpha subunit